RRAAAIAYAFGRRIATPVAPLLRRAATIAAAQVGSIPRISAAKRPEEGADLLRQEFRLLERGEMAAAFGNGPAPDVRVRALSYGARRAQNLLRKFHVTGGRLDLRAVGNRPRPVHARVVRPER